MKQVDRAAKVIYNSVDAEANVIFGALVDDEITDDSVTMTVLATGFKGDGGGGVVVGGGRSGDGGSGGIPDFLQ